MALKNIENNLSDSWHKLVVGSLKNTLDSNNGVFEVPLDLVKGSEADIICEKYFEKYDEKIKYEFRNELYYFRK